MTFRSRFTAMLIAALAIGGCRTFTELDCAAPVSGTTEGRVCVAGTVQYVTIEGGFWALRGANGTTYEPFGAIPESFRREGLAVEVHGVIRRDVGSYRMVGPIIEIIRIRQR